MENKTIVIECLNALQNKHVKSNKMQNKIFQVHLDI